MNLFVDIKSKYGRETLKVVRDLEVVAKKIARFRNHLVLSLRSKHSDITPLSPKIRCPINSARAKTIIKNTERRLVNERIRVINSKLTCLRVDYEKVVDSVERALFVGPYENDTGPRICEN
jgi:hypothetical protein